VAQQTEGKVGDWQLERSCENQIGVTKEKHLLFGAHPERS